MEYVNISEFTNLHEWHSNVSGRRIQKDSIVGLVTVEGLKMEFTLPWHLTCKSQTHYYVLLNSTTKFLSIFRLKKIMSQSCRAHLFFGAPLIQQNSRFEFFLLAWFFFFFSFLWLACQKIQEKIWQTQWNTLIEQQTSSTFMFCLVSCSSKIKFHISKLWPTQIWHVCCSEKKKKH